MPDGTIAPAAVPAAAPVGEYTELGQRAFKNNITRIKQTLSSLANGDGMTRVLAEEILRTIGLPDERIRALITDALDGQVSDPELQEVPDAV